MQRQMLLFLALVSVSELCIVGKPVILFLPNVAEDHQTKMRKP
jgi:hypothetical protein